MLWVSYRNCQELECKWNENSNLDWYAVNFIVVSSVSSMNQKLVKG